ncbi:MAG: endonuclease domain-containing protein [Chloroflexi bacterium]|nr:endonuclease domain-containing protein [Chloroflexota bacterium]
MSKPSEQLAFARELRKNQTEAERFLWTRLRNQRLAGVKFRRQQPIGPYIVDFVSFESKVVIEIDGGQHNEQDALDRDTERTNYLEGRGYRVLRFWNNAVLTNIGGTLEKIRESL